MKFSFSTVKKIEGYSLVEILVVLGLFSSIATLSLGALFNAQAVNARLQETQAILDNINLSMQTVTRDIRFGSDFYGTTTASFVSSGNSGGAEWVTSTTATGHTWSSITYGNGLFVAVGGTDSSGNSSIMTSPDGITWTLRSSSVGWLESVTFGAGLFVAVSSGITNNRVLTSPDGITWTSHASASNNEWLSVTYGNGLFVAVAISGANRVMTSPDGINWTARLSASETSMWQSVTYGNGLFVAVADLGTDLVMTSPNGITWTSRTSAGNYYWNSVIYGNGLFVAVGKYCSGNCVMTSPDGITWTSRTSVANNEWESVTYGNGLFVAVSTDGSGNRVMTSQDGIIWATQISAADNLWKSVTYGNGLFVAVAQSGTNNRVMISSGPSSVVTTRRNCVTCEAVVFKPADSTNDLDRVVYYVNQGVLYKKVYNYLSTPTVQQMTSDDVTISSLIFTVSGSQTSTGANDDRDQVDYQQPLINIHISGVTRPAKPSTPPATFDIQTSVSAREIDNK